jgi:hypothetical protein
LLIDKENELPQNAGVFNLESIMYKTRKTGETLKAPSSSFRAVAAEITAANFLLHSTPKKRETFRTELVEALEGSSATGPHIIAGLKEAGLTHITTNGRARLWIRGLNLSNPDPEEFSSQIKGALSDSSLQDPIELLAKRGQESLASSDGMTEVNEWLEGMEIAVRNL